MTKKPKFELISPKKNLSPRDYERALGELNFGEPKQVSQPMMPVDSRDLPGKQSEAPINSLRRGLEGATIVGGPEDLLPKSIPASKDLHRQLGPAPDLGVIGASNTSFEKFKAAIREDTEAAIVEVISYRYQSGFWRLENHQIVFNFMCKFASRIDGKIILAEKPSI